MKVGLVRFLVDVVSRVRRKDEETKDMDVDDSDQGLYASDDTGGGYCKVGVVLLDDQPLLARPMTRLPAEGPDQPGNLTNP